MTGTEIQATTGRAVVGQTNKDAETFVRKYLPQIERALHKAIPVEFFISAVCNCLAGTPRLKSCTPISFMSALFQCALLGMVPGRPYNLCYLIPYWNGKKKCYEAQFQFDYRGMAKKAREGARIGSIMPQEVRANDEFEYQYGTQAFLRHRPAAGGPEERGEITYYYSVIKYRDGSPDSFLVMSKYEVDRRKSASKARQGEDNPWVKWEEEMGKKTVEKAHLKREDMDFGFARALELDNLADAGDPQPIMSEAEDLFPEQADQRPAETKTEALARSLEAESEIVEPTTEVTEEPPDREELENEIREIEAVTLGLTGKELLLVREKHLRGHHDICHAKLTVDDLLEYRRTLDDIQKARQEAQAKQPSDSNGKEAAPAGEQAQSLNLR